MNHIHRRAVAGFAAALLMAAPLALAATPAQADPSSLQDCSAAGNVFVVVTMEDGTSTGACVSNPASGTAALNDAGVKVTRDATNMICALNDYPNPCPATFNGKYWQYYQASAADAEAGNWAYAQTGSDDTTPQAGWVEGWCYGEECTPQLPSEPVVSDSASPSPDQASAPARYSYTSWIIGSCAVVVIVVAAVVAVVIRRRQAAPEHAA